MAGAFVVRALLAGATLAGAGPAGAQAQAPTDLTPAAALPDPGAEAPKPAVRPQPVVPRRAPLPPRRPVEFGGTAAPGSVANAQPAPVRTANRGEGMPIPATPAAALARVNTFLNSYDSIQADFVQFNPSGQKAEGSLYVKRPGQMRFKYDPPSTLEVVADGRSVAVRDKKLGTNDVYSIGQTPLKFLLKDPIDLSRDTKLIDVSTDPVGVVRLELEDSATFGGTSKLTLIFDAKANELKQWNIVDPQGYRTSVALYNLKVTRRTADAGPTAAPSALERLFQFGR